MSFPRSAVAAAAVLLTASCAVGPNYRRPEAPVPQAFKEAAAPGPAPGEWKLAQPQDETSRGKWWEVFGDRVLNDLEERATAANQTIAQAEAQYRAARAAARGARSAFFPQVTLGASADRSQSSANRALAAPGSAQTINDFQAPLDLSWELDIWGRIRRSLESNVATAQAVAADLESARLLIHAELASDYFQLRGFESEKLLLDTTAAAYGKALELTVNRYNQGVVSGVDVAQAQTQLFTTQALAVDFGISRAQSEHAIAILVGKPPGDFTIAPSTDVPQPPPVPEMVPSQLLERRPDIASAERHVAAANAQIGVAEAAFFPTLALAASGGFEAAAIAKWLTWPSRFWSLGASLIGTVFDGGQRKAATEQAVANYDAAVAFYRQSVLTAFQDVEDNLAAQHMLGEESALQAKATTAAERSLVLAINRYQGGITTYLEVVTAQSAALASESTAVQLATRRMTASVNLIKALGGGWRAADLPGFGTVLWRDKTPGIAAEPATRPQ